ncbi:MAG: hypothetical protein PHS14_03925 [Elusimicrobia bacterium]|nr:hypothetical protein [Elusimicrobiota bacterium]
MSPTCTQMAMASSKFASGTRYVKLGPGSSISQSSPWRGYRRFEYRVNADQVKAMARDLNLAHGASFSTDPKDYQLVHFNLNPEIHFPEGAKGYLRTSFRKISISVIIPPKAPACRQKTGQFDSGGGCTDGGGTGGDTGGDTGGGTGGDTGGGTGQTCQPKIGEFDSPNGCTASICYEDAACPAPGGYVAQGGGCYHKLTGKPQCGVAPIAPAPVPSCQPKILNFLCTSYLCYENSTCPAPGGSIPMGGGCYLKLTDAARCLSTLITPPPAPSCKPRIGSFDSPNGCTAFICYEDLTCSKPAGYEPQGGGCYHKLTGKPRCGTAGGS